MKKSTTRGYRAKALALSVSAIVAGLAIAPAVYAQDEIEEIQVTGSRVRVTDGMAEPTPVTAITATELSNFDPGGTVAEQLDSLPQFFGTQTAQRGGGSLFDTAGGSYLNMRNLGRERTLVLLDGMRVVPGDKRGAVNVDTLPTALLRTVDVVTGGASAAYGADAIGGVTNFVVDRQFEGLKANVGTGVTEMGDGQRWNVSVAGGRKFGERLNVIGSFDSRYINDIQRDESDMDSDFFQRWGWVHNPAYRAADAPGTNPQYLIRPWVSSSIQSPYGLIVGANTGPALASPSAVAASAPAAAFNASGLGGKKFTPDGTNITPFAYGDFLTTAGGTQQNMSGGPEGQIHNRAFGPGGANGNEVVGRSGFLGLQYELTDGITLFGQAMVGRSESNQYSNRAGYEMEAPWTVTVWRDNPYLPANVGAIMDANNFTALQVNKNGSFVGQPEVGFGQKDRNVFGTQSWSVGFDADLNGNWALRGTYQDGTSTRRSQVYDKIRADRMYLASDAVRDPRTGAIVCRVTLRNPTPAELAASPSIRGLKTDEIVPRPLPSPIGLDNTVSDCVPYNVMGNGNVSAAAVEYTGTDKFGIGEVDQKFAEALLTGELFEGWGYGPVSLAGGLTWRDQSFFENAYPADVDALGPPRNDPALGIRGIPAGIALNGSPNLHQFSTVPNVSGEYDVWEYFGELQAPIWASESGDQKVGGSMAFRSSDYSTSGRVDTWKIGVEIEVYSDLRVRATRSRDVREATFAERFDAQGGGGTVNDPTRGNAASQITSVAVGNPNLDPEFADTVVAGFVFQPSWLDGLQVSSDWYEVDVSDAINQLGLQRVVNECAAGNTELCAFVERDDQGIIGRVFNPFYNIATQYVEGVDTEVSYSFEPNLLGNLEETMRFRALFGHVIERSSKASETAASIEITGGAQTPANTATLTANYGIENWMLQLQGRWIDSVRLARIGGGGLLAVSGVDFDDASVASNAWFNAQLGYTGETSNGAAWTAAFSIQNIFDRNPPIIASFGSRGGSQTVSDTYDAEGRRYQLSLNYSF
ncbi:MAG: TonB-dependent receptor plug domain-containing protein [Pseudomonadota bacterium]